MAAEHILFKSLLIIVAAHPHSGDTYSLPIYSETESTIYFKQECPEWVKAMKTGIQVLESNNTWALTNLPIGKNVIGCKWVFKLKRHATKLVAKCYTQIEGIDNHDTSAQVVKMNTARTLLAVTTTKGWLLFQLDVNSAFLHGILQ